MGDKRDTTLPVRFQKYVKTPHALSTQANQKYSPMSVIARRTVVPGGYTNMQIKGKDQSDVSAKGTNSSSKIPCSEDEIFQAVLWIQQQIRIMKAEDNVLMQQFLDLRARIRKLRSHLNFSPTGDTDPTDIITTYYPDISVSQPNIDVISRSGNDKSDDPRLMDLSLSPNQSEDYLSEFRDRTVSMVPLKTSVTKVRTIKKYKTEGFL